MIMLLFSVTGRSRLAVPRCHTRECHLYFHSHVAVPVHLVNLVFCCMHLPVFMGHLPDVSTLMETLVTEMCSALMQSMPNPVPIRSYETLCR